MPTEITAAGYASLRGHVEAAWSHIGVRMGSTEHFRIPTADPRVSVESDATANPLIFLVDLRGDDPEIDVDGNGPLEVDGSALYADAVGGPILSAATFSPPFTFQSADDRLLLRHVVEAPRITT